MQDQFDGSFAASDADRRLKWDRRFLNHAQEWSRCSKDPSTKVGAVLVNDLGQVVGHGYNGFPRKVKDTDERLFDRPTKYKFTVHAEVNACIMAGKEAQGSTLYVYPSFGSPPVCHECMKVVIQSGVIRVVGFKVDWRDQLVAERWKDSIDVSRIMANEAGVEVIELSQ